LVEINVQERPRLGNFKFVGIKKSEIEDIQGKINLAKQTIITENTRRDIIEKVTKYYTDKAYRNVTVRIEEQPDPAFANSNAMTIYINKGKKVHIDNIRFFGNDNVDGLRLKKQMKGTKEMSKATLHADNAAEPLWRKQTVLI
jgi:outer membrane protein insertion porin family